jgi:predicted negative regulator of RcsB-dependent stress response
MATQHLDLEEQEQLDQLKAFWARWGNAITWLLIAVLGAYAAWNGWNYWQRDQAMKAAQLYGELEVAVEAKDAPKALRIVKDMQENVSGTALATRARMLAAKALADADQPDDAKAQLQAVLSEGKDQGLRASSALRLAALEMQAKAFDQALAALQGEWPQSYAGLVADRRADVLQAQGKRDEAVAAYQLAYGQLEVGNAYRQMVAVKLNALGVEAKE